MQQPVHILTQMGVLTSFSVAKKVTESDVKTFFKKHKKTGKTDEQIGEMLREKIFEEIREALVYQKIPGLMSPVLLGGSKTPKDDQIVNKNLITINKLVMVIAHKLVEKKYDKMSLCYFINSLGNMLGLSQDDFDKFYQKMSGESEEESDDDDDDEE